MNSTPKNQDISQKMKDGVLKLGISENMAVISTSGQRDLGPIQKDLKTKHGTQSRQPSYRVMIHEAIKYLKGKRGTSRQAIKKYIEANYGVRVKNNSFRAALDRLTTDDILRRGENKHRWKLTKSESKTSPQKTAKAPDKSKTSIPKTAKTESKYNKKTKTDVSNEKIKIKVLYPSGSEVSFLIRKTDRLEYFMYLTKEFHKVTNTVKFEGVNIQLTIPDVTAKFDNLINQDEARLRFENSLIHRYDTPNGIGLKGGDIIVYEN